jgi:hypothetical protein
MRAGKAYISGLGTTGLLIASSVLLLLVVGALLAFDRWPTQAAVVPEEVAIADAPRPEVVRTHVTGLGASQPQLVQRRALRASAGRAKSRAADRGAPDRRVLAALPAPEVGPRHLSDPPPATNAAPPRDTSGTHPASVLPLPLVGQPIVPLAAELPTSATLDDVADHVAATTPAVGR